MNPEIEQLKQRVATLEADMHSFSDRVAFSKNIELQRGRHISSVNVGRIEAFGIAGTPFPPGWTCVQNSAGNYTITHNLNRTDYVVITNFINDNASGDAGGVITLTTAANSFTLDIASTSVHFSPALFFALLI